MEELREIGKITAKASCEISKSRLGVGFEKLDRNVFDPEKAYDKLAKVGAKWIRIQSGWQRTEHKKGVYDFAWIDSIVDNLIARGMRPWICLCYGNELYDEKAKTIFGAVGCPPIFTTEQKLAWANYVKATVKHFEGRVTHWEIWNEPNGDFCWKHGHSGTEYGLFAIDTARNIRAKSTDATIIGGVVYTPGDLDFINKAFKVGMADEIDAISFHEYFPNDELGIERIRALRALCNSYNPKLKIIQGESGAQSRGDGCGAMHQCAWTPRRQAKQCLRHAIVDLMMEVEFTSYFSCMDMIEALNGRVGEVSSYLDYGYFGLLEADFDENGFASGEYLPKMSYYAYQNLCSVFAEDATLCDLPLLRKTLSSPRILGNDYAGAIISQGFKKNNGAYALAFWNSTPLFTTEFESTVSFTGVQLPEKVSLIDLMDGKIYALPDNLVERENDTFTLKNVPIKDYPMLLAFGDFVQ